MLLNIPSFSLIQPDKNIKGAQVTLGNDNKAFKPDFYGLRVSKHKKRKNSSGNWRRPFRQVNNAKENKLHLVWRQLELPFTSLWVQVDKSDLFGYNCREALKTKQH